MQDLLISVKDGSEQIIQLMDALPKIFNQQAPLTNSHLAFCIDVAQNLLTRSGGQIFICQGGNHLMVEKIFQNDLNG